MVMLLQIMLVVLGLVLLAKGADFLVDGSSKIARRFKIPEIIIGLTIVSIGTSLPELVISVTSALAGSSSISMGNVVGSNFANLFLVISLCATVKPLHMKKQTRFLDQPFVLICTILLYLIVVNDGVVSVFEGVALLLIAILYILYNVLITKYGKSINQYNSEHEIEIDQEKNFLASKSKVVKAISEEKTKFEIKFPTIFAIFSIVIGIALLKIGGDITVENAKLIAYSLGFSEKIVGLTIVALGTSLPELITCLDAIKKNEADLAIGNIAGSQIFNILLVLGASAAIVPIPDVISYREEILILAVGNLIFVLAPFLNEKHRVGRLLGSSFVVFYFSYMVMLVLENMNLIQE